LLLLLLRLLWSHLQTKRRAAGRRLLQ
jgi:hypothetical protein